MTLLRRYPLPLILLLALALRLINLGGRSLWYDEAFAVLFAGKGLNALLYGTLTPVAGGAADIHPLLYYVTLDGWMSLFGSTPFAVRFWSVLLGVVTVGVIYLIARDLFSQRTGYAAALVTAIAPFHVQYSQETRMYALMALLLALATWCFIRGSRPSSPVLPPSAARRFLAQWGWWIAFGILAALAMYTQQLSGVYLAALGLVPVLTKNRRQFIGIAFGALVAVILYLPWLVQLPAQWSKVGSYYWVSTPSFARILLTLRVFFTAALDLPARLSLAALVASLVLLVFLLLQAFMALRRPRHADRASLIFALWLIFAPIAFMWLVSQVRSIYLERALLPSALMLYVALGWLFTRGGLPRLIARAVAVIGIALAGVTLYTHYTWNTFPNSPFPQAADTIRAQAESGDVIVHPSKLTALPMIYYAPDLPQTFVIDVPGSPEDTLAPPTIDVLNVSGYDCVAAAGQGANRIWFVVYQRAEQDYAAAGRTELRDAFAWLDANFHREETLTFSDLNVYLYADPQPDRTAECN